MKEGFAPYGFGGLLRNNIGGRCICSEYGVGFCGGFIAIIGRVPAITSDSDGRPNTLLTPNEVDLLQSGQPGARPASMGPYFSSTIP